MGGPRVNGVDAENPWVRRIICRCWGLKIQLRLRLTGTSKHKVFKNIDLVRIEGPVWYTTYQHLHVVKGVVSNHSIYLNANGKRTFMRLS